MNNDPSSSDNSTPLPAEGKSAGRLRPGDGFIVSMAKLADVDEGTMNILQAVFWASPKVDPNASRDLEAPLKALDKAGIYGQDIVSLYRACDAHPGKMVAVIRATTLGLLDGGDLKSALQSKDPRSAGLDVDGLVQKVTQAVPNFSISRTAPSSVQGTSNMTLGQSLAHVVREADGYQMPPQRPSANAGTVGGLGFGGLVRQVLKPFSRSSLHPLPEIPDTSKVPPVSGHQPDQGKNQGGNGK